MLLAGLEVGLRLADYGYPTSFFKRARIGSEDYFVENDKFGWRFFPPALARSPAPVRMKASKSPDTFRIFLFGESAALGDPRPAFGAGRYLQALLNERYPAIKFEVICVAMTAINSHAILPIARECAQHQGDVWIIYMGNNEMVGPFGATPVFGAQSPPWRSVRLSLVLQKTRIGQLLLALGRKLRKSSADAAAWSGMEMFLKSRVAPNDPHKEIVHRNFERNLEDILRAGIGSGARIVLNTVAVNLKDCPPFSSWQDTNLPAAERDRFDKLNSGASAAESQGNFAQAAQQYQDAARLDPHVADLEFRWADCLLRLTNYSAAREHFERARDLDALPFRTSSKINLLTEQVARRFGGANLIVFDAAGLFATNSPTGVPGQEWFYEHAHLNFGGNYRLARAWAEQLQRFLPQPSTSRPAADWASQEICERRLGLTDWNRTGVLEDLIRRLQQPPLSNQPNNVRRLETLRTWLGQLRARMDKSAAAEARQLYTDALKDSPDDHRLHENFAEFLEAVGDLPQATAEWLRVRQLIPQHHLAYFQAGRLLLRQDKLAEARALLLQAVTLRPDLGEGWLELGKIHAIEGKPDLALQDYEHERRLVPQDYRVYYHIGKALINLNRHAEAMENFQQALRLNPNYWEARYAWGEELAFAGKVADARKAFEEVLQLKPDYAMAHLNLGVALVQQGQLEAAERQFEETLRLEPQNTLAPGYLAQLRARKRPR